MHYLNHKNKNLEFLFAVFFQFGQNSPCLANLLNFSIGFPAARWVLKGLTFSSLQYRRSLFSGVWGGMVLWGAVLGFTNSYYRLNGFVDNGLVWKRKERKFNKYDFTSDFEAGSFLGRLRIRD